MSVKLAACWVLGGVGPPRSRVRSTLVYPAGSDPVEAADHHLVQDSVRTDLSAKTPALRVRTQPGDALQDSPGIVRRNQASPMIAASAGTSCVYP